MTTNITIAGLVALLIPMFMYKRYVDRTLLARKTIPLAWVEIALVVIFAVQVMLRQTLNFLTKLENHRTYESYFRSYSFKVVRVVVYVNISINVLLRMGEVQKY
ncbi:hypothetical protein MSG28_003801 [Choristoneura fumiferana]|uniref:Uncharacterized protein n=1 Tax=Choristoneura fumiferana TaxID=7141 RepID=A0ACC0KGL9_CHOFU|nr:hypothetical protein MSG28_003801 [Choristoneura fumiferana]